MISLKKNLTAKSLTKISVLSVIAFLIMFLEIPLWFAPPFLEVDLSEVPALIGTFALGPMAGVFIELIKNLLNIALQGTDTMAVGELANFIVGSAFVFTAGSIYYKNKTKKNAIIGIIIGTLVMTILMAFANYYILIPFYAKLFGMPLDKIIAMGSAVNKYVVDLKSLIIYAVIPFNLIKGLIVFAITMPLYKKISPILKRE